MCRPVEPGLAPCRLSDRSVFQVGIHMRTNVLWTEHIIVLPDEEHIRVPTEPGHPVVLLKQRAEPLLANAQMPAAPGARRQLSGVVQNEHVPTMRRVLLSLKAGDGVLEAVRPAVCRTEGYDERKRHDCASGPHFPMGQPIAEIVARPAVPIGVFTRKQPHEEHRGLSPSMTRNSHT